MLSAATLIALIFAWYATGIGQAAPYYPILQIVGLAVILVFRGRIAGYIHSKKTWQITLGVALTAFPATIVGHMLGNLIFIALLNLVPALFMATLPISVIEQRFLTILATVVGLPLLVIVRCSYPSFEKL